MPSTCDKTVVEEDCRCIWHPFAQTKRTVEPLHIVKGEGVWLYTESGEAYLDAISSWCVNLHGHAHPYIAKKISEQAHLLEHVIFTDFTHFPAVEYASRLLKILPEEFSRVFYSDNGSTAVECALKMAIQYWHNKGIKKKKILCLKGGYHGDTFGAMSVGGKNAFNHPFLPFLFDVIVIDPFSCEEMEQAVKEKDVICFIYEPLIQGSFGMRTYPAEQLEKLLFLAREHEALLIADEVLTGFGRCGPLFASSLLKTKPDLIALSKGITGGFLPLGATCCREEIFEAFSEKAFFHGHSYTGNPLACTAALASLDLLEQHSCTEARERIHHQHQKFVKKWEKKAPLKRLEALGTFLILEYLSPPSKQFFLDHHIILRPLGNVYYVLPPYCITDEELEKIYSTLEMTWTL